jgi:hypothetical protein
MITCDLCGGLISRYPSYMGPVLCKDCQAGQTPVRVILTCSNAWVPEASVTVENIEEDIQGRDVLTFRCPQCGESHRSFRIG